MGRCNNYFCNPSHPRGCCCIDLHACTYTMRNSVDAGQRSFSILSMPACDQSSSLACLGAPCVPRMGRNREKRKEK